jgi:hypothetical protein
MAASRGRGERPYCGPLELVGGGLLLAPSLPLEVEPPAAPPEDPEPPSAFVPPEPPPPEVWDPDAPVFDWLMSFPPLSVVPQPAAESAAAAAKAAQVGYLVIVSLPSAVETAPINNSPAHGKVLAAWAGENTHGQLLGRKQVSSGSRLCGWTASGTTGGPDCFSVKEENAMKIADVMTASVSTVTPDAPLREAAQLMLQADTGALPVQEGGRVVAWSPIAISPCAASPPIAAPASRSAAS